MLRFTAPNADGQPVELQPGTAFTTYAVNDDGVAEPFNHPWTALDSYSDDDLVRYGITKEVVADPPPPRRQIEKSKVQERVNLVGKLRAAFDVLNAQPLYFGRWFAPDWPNVYADDEGLLEILAAAGCTADEVATITAA